jgi:hypothetical protein
VSHKVAKDGRGQYDSSLYNADTATVTIQTIDRLIISIIAKPFVLRLDRLENEFSLTKNPSLYADSRAFLLYIKEMHSGVFRSLIFSSMIDSQRYVKQRQQFLHDQSLENVVRMRSIRSRTISSL